MTIFQATKSAALFWSSAFILKGKNIFGTWELGGLFYAGPTFSGCFVWTDDLDYSSSRGISGWSCWQPHEVKRAMIDFKSIDRDCGATGHSRHKSMNTTRAWHSRLTRNVKSLDLRNELSEFSETCTCCMHLSWGILLKFQDWNILGVISWESKGPTPPMPSYFEEIASLMRRFLRDDDGLHNPLIRRCISWGRGVGGWNWRGWDP